VLEIHDNSLQTVSVIQYYSKDESSSIKLIYVVLAKDKMVMIYKRTAEDACSLSNNMKIFDEKSCSKQC